MNLKRFTVTSFFLSLTFLGINALTCCQSNGDGPEEKPEIPKPKPQGPMQLTSKVKFPMLAWIGLPPNSSREAYSDMKASLPGNYREVETIDLSPLKITKFSAE